MMTEWEGVNWIGVSHPFDLHEVYLDFRSPLVQGKRGDMVELLISADSRYKFWLNGELIARGPSRSYPHAQSFDRLDLTDGWRDGENVLAVQVYQPGYSHFSYIHRATAGMVAQLTVNNERRLVTDTSWQARRNPSFASDVPRVSIYGSGVEAQNSALNDAWQRLNFACDDWDAARVIASANGHIWRGLRERETAMLAERFAELTLVSSRLSVDNFLFEAPHESLRDAWLGGDEVELVADGDGWFRPNLDFDTTALFLFDLGRAYTCQGYVDIQGASGDEIINISYADKTKDGELVLSDPQTYCRVQLTDSFALREGAQTIDPFSMRGGRYVLFQLSGQSNTDFAFRPRVRVAEYPLELNNPLATNDPQLNAIVTMCENTMRACIQDSFVDCVWRESSQWMGDGLLQSMTLSAMSDDFRPMRKLLRDAATGQDETGILPSILAGEIHAYTIPRYGLMWVELLAFYFAKTGDELFVREMWQTLKTMLMALWHSQNEAGLLVNPTGRRFYIDWSATAQNDPHAVYNLHALLALQIATKLAEDVGVSAENWPTQQQALQQAVRTAFYEDGVWWDDIERTTFSQLAAALALLTQSVPPSEQEALLDKIVARSLDPSDEHEAGKMVLASPFMHHYVFEGLGVFGRKQAIIDIIKQRWGRWAEQGEPTTWENWNIDFPDGSACHAFSAHPRYHLMKAIR